MNIRTLPSRPNIELYKKLAKDVVKAWKQPGPIHWEGRDIPVDRYHIAKMHPRLESLALAEVDQAKFALADAQFIIARVYGFESWTKFSTHIAKHKPDDDPYRMFVRAACVPLDGTMHVDGTLSEANQILVEHPKFATKDIFTAAILGDVESVNRFLQKNPKLAKKKGGPHKWDALSYLCFSRYLRLDKARSEGFTQSARALLEAGANANGGWFDRTHSPTPEWESVLYGASGFAQHAGVTQALLDFGAEPNDNETPYHSPEGYDNQAMSVLVSSGKLTAKSLAMMLVRKADWHDVAGIKLLLENGADPNLMTQWKVTPLHQAIRRDNRIASIDLMLDHGGDPTLPNESDKQTGAIMAARRGRGDVLKSMRERGFEIPTDGFEGLIAACALDDQSAISAANDDARRGVVARGNTLLAEFAGTANVAGVRNLLDLGIPVDSRYHGDGYFGIAPSSTALHVAAWKAHHEVVQLLVERGADVNALDGVARTPLMLAVKACVQSYWMNRRSPDSVRMLLAAGAKTDGITIPCGYDEVDELLATLSK